MKMRYPKLRELKEAVLALIKGPYTSRYPQQPHKPYERFRGRPKYDADNCMGCTACYQVCPASAIEFEDKIENKKARRLFTLHSDICICCGQCQANCPTEKGIVLSNDFELATTESRQELKQTIEKELLLCECCGEVIAPRDQILWVAQKLGPLLFSNASLMLYYLKTFGFSKGDKDIARNEGAEVYRSERIKVLCPRCRREAVIKS